MRTKISVLFLIMFLSCIILSACSPALGFAATTSDPPSPIGVTPIDTSAGTLTVTAKIVEDQDATDGTSNITLQFRTRQIEEDNYVIFDDPNEAVICNGVKVKLLNSQMYNFHVPRKEYICNYSGNTNDKDPLTYVTMFDVPPRSELSPQQPVVTGQGFSIRYAPDSSSDSNICKITATATDAGGDTPVVGNSSPSDLGLYNGPGTGSLHGNGELLLTRTCSYPTFSNDFYQVNLTYISTASVEVTWSH
ncbi:MAG: hypothetical protein NVS3B14_02240 [Ktedonobacteraceae bacterium]